MDRPRYRCPVCLELMWSARAMCAGGTPIYDPAAEPGARRPEHDPALPIPDGEDPAPYRTRAPFEVRHLPYVVKVVRQGSTFVFGPFPAYADATDFLHRRGLFGYSVDALFTPSEADHFRR